MKTTVAIAAVFVAGCGASYPIPTQRMADAQAAERSAKELGADKDPQAQLHLKLADEQIADAAKALKDSDNRRADFLLIRAKADAELALQIAKERDSKLATQQAQEKFKSQNDVNNAQGAVK